MKDTVTIYVCSCGKKFDELDVMLLHAFLWPDHSFTTEELTEEEYDQWLDEQTEKLRPDPLEEWQWSPYEGRIPL